MAFTLYVSVSGETTQLNDSNPFRLESAEDLTGAEVVRHQQRGPLQQGATDLGFRLQPRILTLNILFYAATDAILDGHRDTLMDTFKPLTDISIFLYAVRDDGTTLRLTCKTVDDIDIELAREDRPGHLHRAAVKLRAANPLWVDQAVNSATYTGAALDWWTGGGVISASNVKEHTEYPGQDQDWSYVGSLTGSWSLAFRSAQEPDSGTPTAFHVGTSAITANNTEAKFYRSQTTGEFCFGEITSGVGALVAGTQNYVVVEDAAAGDSLTLFYAGTTQLITIFGDLVISSATRKWRSDGAGNVSTYWTSELPKVAVYDKALSSAERVALNAWMAGSAILGTITLVNGGDVFEYPLVTIRGPIADPYLTNVATGAVLDLRGLALGSADTYTVDLRSGDKLLYNQDATNVMGGLTNPVSMAYWGLAPAPVATGGTNSIRVQGGSISANTRVTIEHYDHYTSI